MLVVQDVVKVLTKSAITGAAKRKMPTSEDIALGYVLAKLMGHGAKGAFVSVLLHSKPLNVGESAALADYWRKHRVPRLYCALAVALGKKPLDSTIGGFIVITKQAEEHSRGQKITSTTGYAVFPNDIKSYFSYHNPLGHPALNRATLTDLQGFPALKTAVYKIAELLQ